MFVSIKWKTYLVFLGCFSIFILSTIFLVTKVLIHDLKESALANANKQIDVSINKLDEYFKAMSTVYYNIVFDNQIIDELQKPADEIDYRNILHKFELLLMANDYKIFSIYMHDIKNNITISTEDLGLHRGNNDWWKTATQLDKMTLIYTSNINDGRNRLISYSGPIRKKYFEEVLGYISVNVLRISMNNILPKEPIYNNSLQFLINEQGEIIAASKSDYPEDILSKLSDTTYPQRITISKTNYIAVSGKSEIHDWKYIELIPENEVFRSVYDVNAIFITLFTIFSFLMLFISYYVFAYISDPILNLAKMIKNYRNKEYYSFKFNINRNDEFRYLYQSITDMIQRIDYLIDEVYKADIYKKETQLRRYQEGINPHFIFNILDSILWIMKFKYYDKAIDVIQNFSSYLRSTVHNDRDFITVAEMKEELSSYCTLASFLKDDLISFKIDFPPEVEKYYVISFMLQPIVENCYKHAFKDLSKGSIYISCQYDQKDMIFIVSDNGVGISEENIKTIKEHIRKKDYNEHISHFGLASVHQRISLHYGEEYGITAITQNETGGTSITVKVPIKEPTEIPSSARDIYIISNEVNERDEAEKI